jgi:muramoyltetrapeptide carboxypeptidase
MTPAPVGELAADDLDSIRPGEAQGPLLGGTLTQLVASLGTPYAFDPPPGYVLLLDEVGERPYRIDRMLTQLTASGVVARAAAVVCGEFPDCDDPTQQLTARGVIADLLGEYSGPVLVGFPTGHTDGPALTVPLGVKVLVVGGRRPRVVVTEAAVT